jgi:hypothetical protein
VAEEKHFIAHKKMKFISFIIVIVSGALALAQLPHCPEPIGEQAYAHPEICDQFFLCVNGTLSLETCENGLVFNGKGGVHNHCAYNWNHEVDCDKRHYDPTPISSGDCEYQFGIYEDSPDCSTSYIKCEYGVPHQLPCERGLVYDHRIHGCNWPDLLLEKCNPEAVVGFKCPAKVDPNSLAARFWPFPRFAGPDRHSLFLCTEGHPRLIQCGEEKIFDESTLTCEDA